jgi:hypothetical protein
MLGNNRTVHCHTAKPEVTGRTSVDEVPFKGEKANCCTLKHTDKRILGYHQNVFESLLYKSTTLMCISKNKSEITNVTHD